MATLRENLMPDGGELNQKVTERPTAGTPFEVHCGVCNAPLFVDEVTFQHIDRALELDPSDSPFCCEACEAEYDEGERHDA